MKILISSPAPLPLILLKQINCRVVSERKRAFNSVLRPSYAMTAVRVQLTAVLEGIERKKKS